MDCGCGRECGPEPGLLSRLDLWTALRSTGREQRPYIAETRITRSLRMSGYPSANGRDIKFHFKDRSNSDYEHPVHGFDMFAEGLRIKLRPPDQG